MSELGFSPFKIPPFILRNGEILTPYEVLYSFGKTTVPNQDTTISFLLFELKKRIVKLKICI
jgi:hypothetical protein